MAIAVMRLGTMIGVSISDSDSFLPRNSVQKRVGGEEADRRGDDTSDRADDQAQQQRALPLQAPK